MKFSDWLKEDSKKNSDKDDLSEQAQAKKGNWKQGQSWFLSATSKTVMNLDYVYINDINLIKLGTFKLYKSKTNNTYHLGYWDVETLQTKLGSEEKDVFVGIWVIDLKSVDIGFKEYNNVVNVDGVVISEAGSYKGNGISTTMYKHFVNELHFNILGDSQQYDGARKLWKNLSLLTDVQVDIIDLNSKEILHKNIILHQGEDWKDFDERLWSYSKNKHNIRSILTKIF